MNVPGTGLQMLEFVKVETKFTDFPDSLNAIPGEFIALCKTRIALVRVLVHPYSLLSLSIENAKTAGESTATREAGGLDFRPQAEKTEAPLGFDVELAPGAQHPVPARIRPKHFCASMSNLQSHPAWAKIKIDSITAMVYWAVYTPRLTRRMSPLL
jgi:hypothetical protein